jgi:hypothetical protein
MIARTFGASCCWAPQAGHHLGGEFRRSHLADHVSEGQIGKYATGVDGDAHGAIR